MWSHYFKLAFRNLRHRRLYSFITISGLALGLACCLVILLFVREELSFDRFHSDADSIYRLYTESSYSGNVLPSVRIMSWMGPGLEADMPEVIVSTRIFRWWGKVSAGNKHFEERLFFADSSFLTVFSFPLLKGNPETALRSPGSVVITQKLAEKYFGDADPVGLTLAIDGRHVFQITGVLADVPKNSHIRFDFLGSFDHARHIYGEDRYEAGRVPAYTYLRLADGADPAALEEKLSSFVAAKKGPAYVENNTFSLQPLKSIHLSSHTNVEIERNSRSTYIYALSAVALIILLIACVNTINLSTARAWKRSREVGVRKAVGAEKKHIFLQFLTESVLSTLTAFFLSLAGVQLLLPVFNSLMDRDISTTFPGFPVLYASFFLVALLVGLLSGSYPAFILSSFRPVEALKGKKLKGGRIGLNLRRGLVVFQFALTTVFLIGTLVITGQIRFIQNRDLGFNTEQVVILPPPLEKTEGYDAFKSQILACPFISGVTSSTGIPGRYAGLDFNFNVEGGDENEGINLKYTAVDFDFFRFFGMEIVRGRDFDRNLSTDGGSAFVLNETAAAKIGREDVIGLLLQDDRQSFSGRVIGIVRDYHNVSLHEEIQPAIYQVQPEMFGMVAVRVLPGRMKNALAYLTEKWGEWAPENIFFTSYLDESLAELYKEETKMRRVFGFAALLTVIIACLGLFALSVDTAEQRIKEIGIRKVLGASVSGLIALMCRDFGIMVLFSSLLACPVIYYIMFRWLNNFAYRMPISAWLFLAGGGLSLLIALFTVSFQAARTALASPIRAIKYE